jgi:hypothetical protein
MENDIDRMRLGVQKTLDELFTERLIPFKLSAHKLGSIGIDEYIVCFYDSRLPLLDISWGQSRGQRFRDVFRVDLLKRVKRLTAPSYSMGTASKVMA